MTEENSLNDIMEESSILTETNKQSPERREANHDTFRSKQSKQGESDIEDITPPFHNEEIIRKSASKPEEIIMIDKSTQVLVEQKDQNT